MSERLIKALAVTCELTGTDVTPEAARVMVDDLKQYPEEQVMAALVKCRKELRGRLTIADVISRLNDGRPGPEEAWAMIPLDEQGSCIWTDEMALAYGVACHHLMIGDRIAARMAFIESYKRQVQEARDANLKVRWIPSLGHDPRARESVLMDAVEKGRMSAMRALELLPFGAHESVVARITENGGEITKRIAGIKAAQIGVEK